MIEETFIASTPKSAYKQAVEKYGEGVQLVSAKQLLYEDGVLRCEVTIAIEEALFMKKSLLPLDDNLEKIKALFVKKGIARSWLDEVCLPFSHKDIFEDDVDFVSYILGEIDGGLEIKKENLESPKVLMLVGPTGVGKTTTIAKLAARYTYLMDEDYKVALLNLDTYKVGAYEQLAHYADIMQIEHISVDTTEAFIEALERLAAYDVILVDTTGMSPYDTKKLITTVEFVQAEMLKKIEINLVLSATVKYEDMDDIYSNFSFLNLDSVLITKFDETKHLGTLLNFMLGYKIPMSYFSIGQEVPDDLLLASKEYLLERFIGDLDEG